MPHDFIKHNRVVYNRIAPFFSATREQVWDDVQVLAEYIKSYDRVLDLGSGNGRLYQIINKKQAHYCGLDQSEELIALARKKFPEAKFVVGEMTELPFPDLSAEVIFCIASFNHIPGEKLQLKCLQEMHRVLKPGGYLLMTNWNLYSTTALAKAKKNQWFTTPTECGMDVMVPWKNPTGENLGERYYHGFTIEELEKLATASSFSIIDQYYSRKGVRVSVEEGANLVSIFRKKVEN